MVQVTNKSKCYALLSQKHEQQKFWQKIKIVKYGWFLGPLDMYEQQYEPIQYIHLIIIIIQ